MTGYYDIVLGIIPVALLGISGALSSAGVTTTSAVTIAAGVGVLIVGHALFVNAPVGSESPSSPMTGDESTQSSQVGPVNAD
jgi:hypothetical protein